MTRTPSEGCQRGDPVDVALIGERVAQGITFGVLGGFVIVPALVLALGFDMPISDAGAG